MADENATLSVLGLTDYESRAYRAMLGENPVTAYRLGKIAGVPLSRIYEIANRLVEKGAATILPGEPARYAPTAPDILVAGARQRLARQMEAIAEDLSRLQTGSAARGISWLRGESAVLAHLSAFLASARDSVFLAGGSETGARLQSLLRDAENSLQIRAVELTGGAWEADSFVALFDHESAVIGRLGASAEALASSHPLLSRFCSDFFRLRSIADAAQEIIAPPRYQRPAASSGPTSWLDWEEEKQRRLLQAH